MELLKLTNIEVNPNHTSAIINDLTNIEQIANTYIYCISKKIKCIITDNSIKSTDLEDEINIIYKGKKYYLTWLNLITINKLIQLKYSINDNFHVTPSIFNIFFINLIDANYTKITNKSISLIGVKNSIFGIYNSYNDYIVNVTNKLYFSFNIFSFILYKVKESEHYIYGKLFPTITVDDNIMLFNKHKFTCPLTFKKLSSKYYGIKKRIVLFENTETNIISTPFLNKQINDFYFKNIVYNTLIIKVNKSLNNAILQNLYRYIINTYPFLTDPNNKVIYDINNYDYPKSTINLMIQLKNNKKYLVIQLDFRYNIYIQHLLKSVTLYLQKLSSLDTVKVIPKEIKYEHCDSFIHIVSEIYFIIVAMIFYLPTTLKNYKLIQSSKYTHANYIFSEKEINNLYDFKNSLFSTNVHYLQSIILKTLSIYSFNYYALMRTNDRTDIIPIKKNMSNKTILDLLDRSSKAELTKSLIWNTSYNIFKNVHDNIETPLIVVNIDFIESKSINSISKVYSSCISGAIPIFINVLYNDTSLHFSLSYKKDHNNFKEAFDTIIDELVK